MRHFAIVLSFVFLSASLEPLRAQPYLFGIDSDLSIADLNTGIVTNRISVGFPLSIGLSIDQTRAFVSDFGDGRVFVIDTHTAAVLASIPVPQACGIAVHPDGSAVYVASRGSGLIQVIDPVSLAVVSSIALPSGLPRGLAISPAGDRLYVSHQDGDGTLTVIDTASNTVLGSTPTASNAQRVSLGPDGSKAYVSSRVPTVGFEMVTIVDTSTLAIDASIRLNPLANACPCAGEVAVHPDGTRFFVAAADAILEYDASTYALISSTPMENSVSMVLSPDGSTAYLGGISGYQVFDTEARTVSPLIPCDFCGREEVVLSNVGPPPVIRLTAAQDTFLHSSQSDTNEGANLSMRVDGNSRALVSFNLGGLPPAVSEAHLRVYVVDNTGNWSNEGRTLDAYRVSEAWSEGNGANLRPSNLSHAQFSPFENRGTGLGATWGCAADSDIHNQLTDCAFPWNGGAYAAAPADSVTIFKDFGGNGNLPPTTATVGWIDFDVTADVNECLSHSAAQCGWLIRKTLESQPGRIEIATREGAAALYDSQAGEPVSPRLIVQP
jgi:YVTN family beta-propeller protein